MFDNVGRKIKTIARTLTWIGIIASFIGGGILAVNIAVSYMFDMLLLRLAVALIAFVLAFFAGSFVSWISMIPLYAFGQLTQNSDILVKYAKKSHSSNENLLNELYDDDDIEDE